MSIYDINVFAILCSLLLRSTKLYCWLKKGFDMFRICRLGSLWQCSCIFVDNTDLQKNIFWNVLLTPPFLSSVTWLSFIQVLVQIWDKNSMLHFLVYSKNISILRWFLKNSFIADIQGGQNLQLTYSIFAEILNVK